MEYWRSIEELLDGNEQPDNKSKNKASELLENSSKGSSRRDFLKIFGFSITSAAILASCEKPVKKAIPLLIQPEEVKPGTANYYASTFYDGNEACSILVKVRDGRPIKIEGNDLSPIIKGGSSARVQAALLNLYDETRPQYPTKLGQKIGWEVANREIVSKIESIQSEGKKIVILTPTIISPSTKYILEELKSKYTSVNSVTYDAISYSAIRDAYQSCFGTSIIPSLRFDNTSLVVAFNADFLGTWLEPLRFARQYSIRKDLTQGQKDIIRHIQFETTMSLTGSNADERIIIRPDEEALYIHELYNEIAKKTGNKASDSIGNGSKEIQQVAKELIAHKGKSLVVSGSNDLDIQLLVCSINSMLGSYGATIDINEPVAIYEGSDRELLKFHGELKSDKIGGVLFYHTNPLYDFPSETGLVELIEKLDLSVSISDQKNETVAASEYVLPANHFLESWDDAEPIKGYFSLSQPAIRPIFDTKQSQDILLGLLESVDTYYNKLKLVWEKEIYPTQSKYIGFEKFWKFTIRDGVYQNSSSGSNLKFSTQNIDKALNNISQRKLSVQPQLHFYLNIPIGDGRLANNPWLQELPDPVSRICWDNYVAVSPSYASLRGLSQGDIVSVGNNIELPVFIQPGQHKEVFSIALGYGHYNSGTVSTGVGKNVYPLVLFVDGYRQYYTNSVDLVTTGRKYELAATQTHHSMEGRALIRETTINEYKLNPSAGNEMHAEVEEKHVSLYKEHEYKGHHWAMVIDLNKCIGCNSCVVACSAENNVPVVGRDEVRRAHEMHWLRIDRYYNGDLENPSVVRQPVMCQHCDNAPCENVCPVAATNHSSEGINQMAYNRCIGTRYCNNNCPYKVRRFNWFDYTGADSIPFNTIDPANMTVDIKRMVLNPDVTVRAKGVIEKCSFCIQRIQDRKLNAKRDGRQLRDGEIKTACQQSCPTDAIVFGDVNDPNSRVSKLMKDPRSYHLLEELHTLPSVAYLTKVRNKTNTKNLS